MHKSQLKLVICHDTNVRLYAFVITFSLF